MSHDNEAGESEGESTARAGIIDRLYAALDAKMREIEERMASGESMSPADGERDARTMHSLARLYEKLGELEEAERKARGDGKHSGAGAKDAERFRREIAERLEKMLGAEPD